jgi:large subunit ribosomal protein L31
LIYRYFLIDSIAILELVIYFSICKVFMKTNIHPELYDVTAQCTCGNSFATRSTKQELRVTLCSACHPFYTGAQKFVDTAGRIEKFEKKYQKGAAKSK